MLGRKTFTQGELDQARKAVDEQVTALRSLGALPPDTEAALVSAAVLALDRRFVHRLRSVTGKGGGPLNELELLAEALMDDEGAIRSNSVIRYAPDASVLGLAVGDRVCLTVDGFERLANAVLAELEDKFLER